MDMRDLVDGAQAILLVALVAAAGLIILDEFRADQETTSSQSNDTINCTATLGTAVDLERNDSTPFFVTIVNASFISATNVTNTSNNTALVLRNGNFTLNIIAGTITCSAGGVVAVNEEYNVSYQYTIGSDARNTFIDGITSVGEITSWLDIIALIIAASIILYFVFKGIRTGEGKERY